MRFDIWYDIGFKNSRSADEQVETRAPIAHWASRCGDNAGMEIHKDQRGVSILSAMECDSIRSVSHCRIALDQDDDLSNCVCVFV